jgi:hypothetical protein
MTSPSFRLLASVGGGVCLALAAAWLLAPQAFLWLWRWDAGGAALPLGRRSAALFLGVGVTLLLARNAGPSTARDAIAVGFSVVCAALAALGVYEVAAGHAGFGILAAVVVEAALAAAFAHNAAQKSGTRAGRPG